MVLGTFELCFSAGSAHICCLGLPWLLMDSLTTQGGRNGSSIVNAAKYYEEKGRSGISRNNLKRDNFDLFFFLNHFWKINLGK
jgi:hypothetical protein